MAGNMTAADVAAGTDALATQYNSLFTDLITNAGDYAATTGSANAYVLAINAKIAAYADGQVFKFKGNFENTGAATLNVNTLGAKTIKKNHDEDLESGDIENGQVCYCVYDGTNMQLLNPTGNRASWDERKMTSTEGISQGDIVALSGNMTVQRYAPTALPTTWDQSATRAGTFSKDSSPNNAILVDLSTTVKFFVMLDNDSGAKDVRGFRLPITPSTGAVATIADSNLLGMSGGTYHSIDAVKMDSTRALVVASKTNDIRMSVLDLTSTLTEGTPVTVDSSNCDQAFCDYISDSHVLVIYQDTSTGDIVFSKKTVSGTTISASSTGTVTTPVGTYTLRGVRRFLGTDLFLLIVQNDTDGSAECAVATYTEGSSTFTACSAWVHFPGDIDISSSTGDNVSFAQMSATQMIVTFPTSTTNIDAMLITISGTTPSCGSVITTTRGSSQGYSLTKVNARCAFQNTANGTTTTSKLLEIDSTGALTTRSTASITGIGTGATALQSGACSASFYVNPLRQGSVGLNSSDDLIASSALYTLPTAVGIARTTVATSTSIAVITDGYSDDLAGLTYGTKYYCDIAGLPTTDSNGTPDKLGIGASSTELLREWW